MGHTVLLKQDGAIATLTLNRPEAFNAIGLELAQELTTQFQSLAVDDRVRAIIITGVASAFSSGGDLKWVLAYPQGPWAALRKLAGEVCALSRRNRSQSLPEKQVHRSGADRADMAA